MKKFCW